MSDSPIYPHGDNLSLKTVKERMVLDVFLNITLEF